MTTKKYSLRKVKVGVASVLVGFGVATTGAAVANATDAQPSTAAAGVDTTELEKAFTELEKAAVEKIDADKKITDKEAAKKEAIEAIGKEDLINAIKNEELSLDTAVNNLPTEEEVNGTAKETITKAEPTTKDKLPADIKAAVEKAEKEAEKEAVEKEENGASSEDKQEYADSLTNQINKLTKKVADIVAAAEEKAKEINTLTDEYTKAKAELEAAKANEETADVINALDKKVAKLEAQLEAKTTAFDEASKKDKETLEKIKANIDFLTDEYNVTLGEYHLAKVAELEKEVQNYLEALNSENLPADLREILEAKYGEARAKLDEATAEMERIVNLLDPTWEVPTTAPVADALPEFTGGVNGAEPAVLEKPEYPLPTNPQSGSVNTSSFGQDTAKPEVKEASASLPNTGLNSTSTTVAGLGLIALVGLAVRRKFAK